MDSIREMALQAAELLDDKKGQRISILDVRGMCAIADYFVIASGTSDRHAKALAESVEDGLAKQGIRAKNKEGHREANWIILDYLDVVVHVFRQEQRDYYSLERIWRDARQVELNLDSVSKSI